ncbi:DUF3817 domain-containing protein [Allonocardiopsis opalescens]|uniref:Integral membrane protein n=1 Tax=Allonocardiopsis opalescens TaxID=1144618 RepID=A0A2T0Q6G0_9ACTN|nr:DUF3817 domain-containing protein [Allonocardiopsis opalescens]PRX99416.1 integral membrane protein [Allonocardiopsis opalescens]
MRSPALLTAYRVASYVTGVGLILLVFVAVPLKWIWDQDLLVAVIGPIHGFLYIAYVVLTLALMVVRRWSPGYALLIMLAGTVPVMSFVAERSVTRRESAAAAAA